MKTKTWFIIIGLCTLFDSIYSCQKTSASLSSSSTDSATASIAAAALAVQAVAVGSLSSSASASDSIYIIHTCSSNNKRDSIAFNSLPLNVLAYLDSAYAGFTALDAFSIADSKGVTNGCIAVIQYDEKPVGIKFDASGNFIKVLEQKLGKELHQCINDNSSDSTQYSGIPQFDSTHRDTARYH